MSEILGEPVCLFKVFRGSSRLISRKKEIFFSKKYPRAYTE